jgi:hypothetical protein
MESVEEGRIVFVKLADGEDVFAGLEAAARKHRVDSGAIHWAIGMLKDFEIGFFAPGGYERSTYPDRHELLGFHGSISMRAEPKFHIHVTVAGRDHAAVGGHLFRGKACVVNEICLERFDTIRFTRRLSEETGLRELTIEGAHPTQDHQ